MVIVQRPVLFATNNMSVKPKTNFPGFGHHTAVIGTDPIVTLVKITKIKWPCRGTFSIETPQISIET